MTTARSREPLPARRVGTAMVDDDFGGIALRRMPALGMPFALVAATAAFFSVFALAAAFWTMQETSPLVPAIFAVVPGALAGGALRRWRRLYATFASEGERRRCVALVVVVAGASIGAVLGLATWGTDAVGPCLVGGALTSLAFVPSALAVHGASMRAARARHGSIVAEVDRRSVMVTVLSCVTFATLTQSPALAVGHTSFLLHPFVQPLLSSAVAVACALSTAWILRSDRRAKTSLEALGREVPWLDRTDATADDDAAAALDLGLGDDRWSRSSAAATYRIASRPEVILRGSVNDALRAIDDALAQRRRALTFSAVASIAPLVAFAIGRVL